MDDLPVLGGQLGLSWATFPPMPTATASPASTVLLTVDNAIDIPANAAADDATLTAAIELAQQWMRDLRRDRSSLAFQDAKRADISLRAERDRRNVAAHQAASRPALPRLHPCGTGCTNSAHPVSECACACLGANHSPTARQGVLAFDERTDVAAGFSNAMVAAMGGDEPW